MKRIAILILALLAAGVFLVLVKGRNENKRTAPTTPAMPEPRALSLVKPSAKKVEIERPGPLTVAVQGSLVIRAQDAENNRPLAGVKLSWLGKSAIVGKSGWLRIHAVPVGTRIMATRAGYEPAAVIASGAGEQEVLLMRARLDVSLLDANTLAPVKGAKLFIDDKQVSLNDGMANVPLPTPGKHKVRAILPGYLAYERNVEVSANNRLVDVRLFPFRVEGEVVDAKFGKPINGAKITLLGHSTATDVNGGFVLQGLPGMEKLALAKTRPVFVFIVKDGYEEAKKRIMPVGLTPAVHTGVTPSGKGDKNLDAQLMEASGWEARVRIELRRATK